MAAINFSPETVEAIVFQLYVLCCIPVWLEVIWKRWCEHSDPDIADLMATFDFEG